jgi:hypothetical protein
MTRRAAAEMLLDRIPDDDDLSADESMLATAERVAERLGYLPLALDLAGTYLGTGLADVHLDNYLATLSTPWSVFSTWRPR